MSFFKFNFWTSTSYLEDTHLEMEEPIYIYVCVNIYYKLHEGTETICPYTLR